jgi:hypothetical protein
MQDDVPEGMRLVHGYKWLTDGSRVPIAHAWLLAADGRVYDAVEDKWYDADEYPGQAADTYTKEEAFKLAVDSGHSGPWGPGSGV